MPDNLKKKKLDRKRVSLKQKHEKEYVIRIAEQLLSICKNCDNKRITFMMGEDSPGSFAVSAIKRICKALLKCLK